VDVSFANKRGRSLTAVVLGMQVSVLPCSGGQLQVNMMRFGALVLVRLCDVSVRGGTSLEADVTKLFRKAWQSSHQRLDMDGCLIPVPSQDIHHVLLRPNTGEMLIPARSSCEEASIQPVQHSTFAESQA